MASRLARDQVEHFAAMAQDWWDPAGPMAPLHAMNPIRLAYIKRVAARHFGLSEQAVSPFDGLRALDVGCGGGLLSEPLARLGFSVTGIDPAVEVVAVARDHATEMELPIDYRVASVEDIASEGRSFDLVTLLEVVEHVPDPAGMIRHAARILRPGGLLIASTLNRTLASFALAIVGAEYVLRMLPVGTHSHRAFVTPDELSAHLAAAGLTEMDRTGLVYDPLRRQWAMSGNLSVNYIMSARAG